MRIIFKLIILVAFPLIVVSGEVDQFTNRDKNERLNDSRSYLNRLTNNTIRLLLKKNFSKTNCNSSSPKKRKKAAVALFKGLQGTLNTEPLSSIHRYVAKHRKKQISTQDSIYREVAVTDSLMTATGLACCSLLMNVSDKTGKKHMIGADKISHFFTHGLSYYLEYLRQGGDHEEKMKAVLIDGDSKENGAWGKQTTGVYSYGDLAANMGGFYFWLSVLGTKKPLIKCNQTGKYEMIRDFDWGDYVTAAWDEAINCSTYKSEDYKDKVRIVKCPLYPKECTKLISYYGKYAKNIVSPSCHNRPANQKKHLLSDEDIYKFLHALDDQGLLELDRCDTPIEDDERYPEFSRGLLDSIMRKHQTNRWSFE